MSSTVTNTAVLRPELEERLTHVRGLLASELAAEPDACITCSFQAEDVLLLHLTRELKPEIPVLFLIPDITLRRRMRIATRLLRSGD